MPKDWRPTDELLEWAVQAEPTWDLQHAQRVAESFRDYWVSKSGKDATKVDWGATWRNWVRREGPRKAGRGAESKDRAKAEEAVRMIEEGSA